MTRKQAIQAVRSEGMTVTAAAMEFGVSQATLHRRLRTFDPARPIASARPQKRGPKGPRWGDETINEVIDIIEDHPDWWGRRRVSAALAERGIVLSERTVGDVLPVARQRLARARDAQRRAAQARNSRRVAAMIRRDERAAERRELVRRKFEEILVPGVTAEEAVTQIAAGLAAKGWKFQVKDLTPELSEFADAYLHAAIRAEDGPDDWLFDAAYRWRNRDHARVAAINHFVKRHKPRTHTAAAAGTDSTVARDLLALIMVTDSD